MFQIDKQSQTPRYLQLYQQIIAAIARGELKQGDKLPPKRQLCEMLSISQNTVESAYGQLVAEGYVQAEARRGFFICVSREKRLVTNPPHTPAPLAPNALPARPIEIDFNPNRIDPRPFPFHAWKKAQRRALNFDPLSSLELGEKQGEIALRREIATYLAEQRGVHCDPNQIIIGAGVETCLTQLIWIFRQHFPQRPFRYAMEAFGYPTAERIFTLQQCELVKLPAQSTQLGARLRQEAVNCAYLTPSHQYPFGNVLPIRERDELLAWANASAHHFIIEDDYDSEFRYQGKPIPALHSLDKGQKVIYLGSFSKLLMPALRITFMVLPPVLLKAYQQSCAMLNNTVPKLHQLALAEFMQQGEFTRHIQRMRKIYRAKMQHICQQLAPFSAKLRYFGEQSGFYLLLEIFDADAETLQRQAETAGIKIACIPDPERALFSLGFGHLSEAELDAGIARLLDCWQITA